MAPCEDDIATASTGWDRQVSPEVEEREWNARGGRAGREENDRIFMARSGKGSKKRFAWKHVVMEKNPLCEVEVELLRRMKHENIVGIHDVYSAFGVMDIMLELCKGGSMREYMLSKSEEVFRGCTVYEPPEPSEVRNTMHQLLTALNFLHGNLVAHRDIKPDNVLLSSRGRWKTWKLADFNLACEFEPKSPMTETVGSRPFTAPEVYEGHYTETRPALTWRNGFWGQQAAAGADLDQSSQISSVVVDSLSPIEASASPSRGTDAATP
eukprot:g1859.t1